MRALVLLVFVMLSVGGAVAQDNAPTPTTGETNDTPTDDGGAPAGNETADEEPPAEPAAPDCIASVTLVGNEDLRWYLPDGDRANPPLNVCPSAPVTFTLTTAGGVPHNFLVQAPGAPPVSDIFSEGDTVNYVWETPESGSFTYICQLHGRAMSGTVNVGADAPATGGEGGGEGEITGPTVSLKQVAPDAQCDRPIPAVVTRDVVGGPVVQDYVEGCVRTEEVQEPPAHPSDLVIPISFLLIGIGVVAMVWVHKSYKP